MEIARRIAEAVEHGIVHRPQAGERQVRSLVTLTGETRTLERGWRMESRCTIER